jgi:SAM-dependent methyltransferase
MQAGDAALILDVGCGGVYSAFNPKIRGEDVIYVDIGKPTTKIPRFIRADADFLPLRNATIDEVYASHVIEHVDSINKFLAECYRVLILGGRLHVWTPNFASKHAWLNPEHKRSFTYFSLRDTLIHYGFHPTMYLGGIATRFLPKSISKVLAILLLDELHAVGKKPWNSASLPQYKIANASLENKYN